MKRELLAFAAGIVTGAAIGLTLGLAEYDARVKDEFLTACTGSRPIYECLALWRDTPAGAQRMPNTRR